MKLLETLFFIGLLIDFTYSCKCQKLQCNGPTGTPATNDPNTGTPATNAPNTPKTPTTTAHTTTSTTKSTITPPTIPPSTTTTTTPTTTTTTTATSTIPTTTSAFIRGSCKVHVGYSDSNNKTATVPEGCECPDVVNKVNWLSYYWSDEEFAVIQNGTSLVVQRIDDNGGWGMNLAFMCEPSVCQKAYGKDYTGSVNITKSGFTCQNWTSQSPHKHSYSYVGDHNYCRSPQYRKNVWCYTTNPDKIWEFCDVPLCDCDITEFTCLSDNVCIPEYYICDYEYDCQDESDEGTVCDDFYGDYSSWSNWTACSATCGIGLKFRNRTCLEHPCREEITDQTEYCKLPACGEFGVQQKCFSNDSDVETLLDIGHNHWGQTSIPIWEIHNDGRHLLETVNTRPSVGLSNLGPQGDTSKPVSFSGRIYSHNGDRDVIGLVFGFLNERNFFVIASAGTNKGPTNWYVGRLHATCGESCQSNTTISDAIWVPSPYPNDITVLSTGSDYWRNTKIYNFTICFDPSELLLSVNIIDVTDENNVESVLETGVISAKTNDTNVDEESRLGGYVGVYVDSQMDTNWDNLYCRNCDLNIV